jgi:Ca2+-binding EF-hand superfamily protein
MRVTIVGLGFGLALAGVRNDLPEFLKRFDTNDDHQIDEEERQAIRDLRSDLKQKKRQSIDSNEDGIISPEEVKTARRVIREKIAARRREKFLTIAGEDGAISPSEYSLIPGVETWSASSFDRIWSHLDLDNDGLVSFEEFEGTLRPHTAPEPEGD